jgi:hypothetical protein
MSRPGSVRRRDARRGTRHHAHARQAGSHGDADERPAYGHGGGAGKSGGAVDRGADRERPRLGAGRRLGAIRRLAREHMCLVVGVLVADGEVPAYRDQRLTSAPGTRPCRPRSDALRGGDRVHAGVARTGVAAPRPGLGAASHLDHLVESGLEPTWRRRSKRSGHTSPDDSSPTWLNHAGSRRCSVNWPVVNRSRAMRSQARSSRLGEQSAQPRGAAVVAEKADGSPRCVFSDSGPALTAGPPEDDT